MENLSGFSKAEPDITPAPDKALVIFSGGQDSTTCLYWALATFAGNVEAITFNYGQNHHAEVYAAAHICEKEGIKQARVNLGFFKELVESNLVKPGADVNKINDKGLPSSFVPNRNQLFITIAHAYAQKIGAHHLVTGVCQTDYSGYPDCRQEFIHGIENLSNYGSKSNLRIHTPLMQLNKAQTFKMAADLGKLDDIIELTHTCYNGARRRHEWGYGCNSCPACLLRRRGYYEYLEHFSPVS